MFCFFIVFVCISSVFVSVDFLWLMCVMMLKFCMWFGGIWCIWLGVGGVILFLGGVLGGVVLGVMCDVWCVCVCFEMCVVGEVGVCEMYGVCVVCGDVVCDVMCVDFCG